jgi:cytochrome c oxidase subunit 3
MPEAYAPHEFQYANPRHQAETAIAGLWLFLATEMLFFGGLILSWIYCRHWNQTGFDAGARETDLAIGTINTVILVTGSLVFSLGLTFLQAGRERLLVRCCALALALGVAFFVLKFGVEWREDFHKHLFPGPGFGLTGNDESGAQLFFTFYFVGTALHGVHLLAGLGLVGWIMLRAYRGEFSAPYHTPVEVVGLYWSFVDIVWLVLYPLIYLVGRGI